MSKDKLSLLLPSNKLLFTLENIIFPTVTNTLTV